MVKSLKIVAVLDQHDRLHMQIEVFLVKKFFDVENFSTDFFRRTISSHLAKKDAPRKFYGEASVKVEFLNSEVPNLNKEGIIVPKEQLFEFLFQEQ